MENIFESDWWSVQLPAGWEWEEDEDCIAFFSDDSVGALEVSACRKEDEAVNNNDLLEFIPAELREITEVAPVVIGEFTGFYAQYIEDDSYWRQWWLKVDRLMIYVTYNASTSDGTAEDAIVNEILSTLKPQPAGR